MKKIKTILTTNFAKIFVAMIIAIFCSFGLAYAGSLTPSSTPAPTMYTLNNIYTRLTTNDTATEGDHSLSTSTSPVSSFYTLKQIYDAIPTIDPTKVLAGTTYLGVAGTASAGGIDAALLKTGQTLCFDPTGSTNNTIDCAGTGQDADLNRGVALSYTDNGDNTVTDNSTGLTWIKDPGAINDGVFGNGSNPLQMTFEEAIENCESLSYASHTDWHLPNIRELLSLIDYSRAIPAINPVFSNTQASSYWSSTSYEYPGYNTFAWFSNFNDGNAYPDHDKTNAFYVRCFRG